jgi:hypothetical protein
MREQPVPRVDRADVERIVRRDFPADAFDEILGIVDRYQSDHGVSASARVHLAALKLAQGNRDALCRWVNEARMDYRDVLAPAEYPLYLRKVHGPSQPRDVDEIIEADWHEYQAWLNR